LSAAKAWGRRTPHCGHEAVVRLLVERGAWLDIRDTIWRGTPLGWAIHGGGKAREAMAECLRSLGAINKEGVVNQTVGKALRAGACPRGHAANGCKGRLQGDRR
jgi:hypothetical protein